MTERQECRSRRRSQSRADRDTVRDNEGGGQLSPAGTVSQSRADRDTVRDWLTFKQAIDRGGKSQSRADRDTVRDLFEVHYLARLLESVSIPC